ncbi:Lactamase-B domain-containing protein [Aphelenchoides besseyi]|nr:Lactamase-B domain-containing protein [Aphelenchoides besseyi]KAI6210594.1 Lactamase-B domain-containing protein [Aphelenchoides besseyi]
MYSSLIVGLLLLYVVNADVVSPNKITFLVGEDGTINGNVSTISLVTSNVRRSEPQTSPAPQVRPLVVGSMYPTERGYSMVASVTFVADSGYYMVIDTPSATDFVAKDQMFKSLSDLGVLPSQIHFAVKTHSHPDHFGQDNFFSNARHFFGPYEYAGSNFDRNELFNRNEIRLTENIDIWNTPGHTTQDISVIVRNVVGYGTVGIVGDLFYSEIDALSDGTEWIRDAWNGRLGLENRRRVICACDTIIPGHSKLFLVNAEMRMKAGCQLQIPSIATANEVTTFRSDPQPPKQTVGSVSSLLETVQPTLISLAGQSQPNPLVDLPPQQPNPTIAPVSTDLVSLQSSALNVAPLPLASSQYANQQAVPTESKSIQQGQFSGHSRFLRTIVLYPMIESAATNIAHYLSAAQSNAVPTPYLQSAEVRTYPALYPIQVQALPQGQLLKKER